MANRLGYYWLRREVYERGSGLCGFCHRPVEFDAMHVDHIHPSCVGGSDDLDNLQPAHPECNRRAGAKGYRNHSALRRPRGKIVHVGIKIPPDLHARLKSAAAFDDRSLHWEALRVFRLGLDAVEAAQQKAS